MTEKNFVKVPNLPERPAKSVIIGESYAANLSQALNSLNIDIISLPVSQALGAYVANHADMLLIHICDNRIIVAKALEGERKRLEKLGFEVIVADLNQQKDYPFDIGLNMLIIGNKAFGNLKYTDPAVLRELRRGNIEAINVKQGYAKCSVCIVDGCSAITADKNIYSVLISAGIEVLLIQPGHIELPGYEYGFIGGACGKISHDKVAFTGRLNGHPDMDKIIRFMEGRGVEPVFLTDKNCFDIGSIIPIV